MNRSLLRSIAAFQYKIRSYRKPKEKHYLEHVDLSGSSVNIELAIGRVFRIDALSSQEVNDALRPVLIPVACSDLKHAPDMSGKYRRAAYRRE